MKIVPTKLNDNSFWMILFPNPQEIKIKKLLLKLQHY